MSVDLVVTAHSSATVSTRVHVATAATPGNAALLDVIDDPDLLSLIVPNLTAHDQCSLARCAKLLALVVTECQREISYMHSAVTDSVEQEYTMVRFHQKRFGKFQKNLPHLAKKCAIMV